MNRTVQPIADGDLAREAIYRFLAAALAEPTATICQLLFDEPSRTLARLAADVLREEVQATATTPGFGELPVAHLDLRPALAALPSSMATLHEEFNRVFGLVYARDCTPYETEYLSADEPFHRAQQMADIAGFYQAFGLRPSAKHPERPDHVALQLEFMAVVLTKKRLAGEQPDAEHLVSTCDEVQRAFVRDHLAPWLPSFATNLSRKAGSGFYAEVGRFLAAFIPTERQRFDVPPPRLPLQAAFIEQPEEQTACAACMS